MKKNPHYWAWKKKSRKLYGTNTCGPKEIQSDGVRNLPNIRRVQKGKANITGYQLLSMVNKQIQTEGQGVGLIEKKPGKISKVYVRMEEILEERIRLVSKIKGYDSMSEFIREILEDEIDLYIEKGVI